MSTKQHTYYTILTLKHFLFRDNDEIDIHNTCQQLKNLMLDEEESEIDDEDFDEVGDILSTVTLKEKVAALPYPHEVIAAKYLYCPFIKFKQVRTIDEQQLFVKLVKQSLQVKPKIDWAELAELWNKHVIDELKEKSLSDAKQTLRKLRLKSAAHLKSFKDKVEKWQTARIQLKAVEDAYRQCYAKPRPNNYFLPFAQIPPVNMATTATQELVFQSSSGSSVAQPAPLVIHNELFDLGDLIDYSTPEAIRQDLDMVNALIPGTPQAFREDSTMEGVLVVATPQHIQYNLPMTVVNAVEPVPVTDPAAIEWEKKRAVYGDLAVAYAIDANCQICGYCLKRKIGTDGEFIYGHTQNTCPKQSETSKETKAENNTKKNSASSAVKRFKKKHPNFTEFGSINSP